MIVFMEESAETIVSAYAQACDHGRVVIGSGRGRRGRAFGISRRLDSGIEPG
jgi:hypothetical protein